MVTTESGRCPWDGESLTNYTDDDLVYLVGDERPYCSGECVIAAHRAALREAAAGAPPVESFGHEPWFICLPDFTKGYACARCRVKFKRVWLDEYENLRIHIETHGVPWPCATAVVLGLEKRTAVRREL